MKKRAKTVDPFKIQMRADAYERTRRQVPQGSFKGTAQMIFCLIL